jgi:hypothetical protein
MGWCRLEQTLTWQVIADRLARTPGVPPGRPDQRTIGGWMAEARGDGPTWTLGSVQPGDRSGMSDAVIVLRLLGTLASISGNRRATISQEEADWTVRIARAAPTIDPLVAFQVGKLYSDRLAHGRETRSLDVYLGAAPWNDDAAYRSIIENDGVEEWFGQGWHPPLELALRQYYDLPPEKQVQRLPPTAAEEALRAESPGWFVGSSPPSESGG